MFDLYSFFNSRLMFCNTLFKEGCYIKESVIAKRNYSFLCNQVSNQFHFVCFGNSELKLQSAIGIQEVSNYKFNSQCKLLCGEGKVRRR